MFLEMFVAVLALLTALVGVGYESYQTLVGAGKNAGVFAVGLATFLSKIGIPESFGLPYASVFLALMALTIMYLVVRFMRVASAEFLGDQIPVLRNVHVGTVVALVLSAILIWTGFWARIWVLFGGANQLMASLALLIISLWLMSKAKNYQWTIWPFGFMFITTIAALIYKAVESFSKLGAADITVKAIIANVLIGCVSILLVVAALFLAWDAFQAIRRLQATAKAPAEGGE
jgi:carbon starvation protein